MKLEFYIYEINKDTTLFKLHSEHRKEEFDNEFIVVGEVDKENCKILNLGSVGLTLTNGLKLDSLAYEVKKKDLNIKSIDGISTFLIELDIPKDFLTMELIETIQRLNS